jgi:hypothetical protein
MEDKEARVETERLRQKKKRAKEASKRREGLSGVLILLTSFK